MTEAQMVLHEVVARFDEDRRVPIPKNRAMTVGPAILLAHRRYVGELTVAQMAAAVQMSRFHFIRVFRRETGLTPYGFLMRLRIARAMALLRETDRPVHRIGQEVGYLNAAAFSRAFLDLAGMSPQVYRMTTRTEGEAMRVTSRTATPPPVGQAEAFSVLVPVV